MFVVVVGKQIIFFSMMWEINRNRNVTFINDIMLCIYSENNAYQNSNFEKRVPGLAKGRAGRSGGGGGRGSWAR